MNHLEVNARLITKILNKSNTLIDLEKINSIVAEHQPELIELLCKLIRIPTINTGHMPKCNPRIRSYYL